MEPEEQSTVAASTAGIIDLQSNEGEIEKLFVSESKTAVYIGTLIRFMLWLHDKKREHLAPGVMEILEREHQKDEIERIATRQSWSKGRGRKTKKDMATDRKI